jgi:hypothetical protein
MFVYHPEMVIKEQENIGKYMPPLPAIKVSTEETQPYTLLV